MKYVTSFLRSLLSIASLWSFTSSQLTAQTADRSGPELSVTGYLRSLTGVQDLGYDLPVGDRFSGFHSQVFRLKWLVDLTPAIHFSVHNRVQLRLTTVEGTSPSVLGFGVSAVPSRTVDLEQIIVDRPKTRLSHDIDRVALSAYLDVVDLTVGRQAITWGISSLFPVADVWARFSPFELDTEEKPGVDAVRALMYPASGLELDLVVADRGRLRDLSAGVRLTAELPMGDLYAAVGKWWRQGMGMVGLAIVFDSWKVRSEVVLPLDIDSVNVQPVRATVGVDWISSDVQVTAEYHHNGLGATDADDYGLVLNQAQFLRGESYYLGRHYLGIAVSHQVTDRLSLILSNLLNITDPSLALTPAVVYDAGQNIRIGAGGLVSFGRTPSFGVTGIPVLRSEFGSYGDFAYGQFSLYF